MKLLPFCVRSCIGLSPAIEEVHMYIAEIRISKPGPFATLKSETPSGREPVACLLQRMFRRGAEGSVYKMKK
jgi:hypothetical protein